MHRTILKVFFYKCAFVNFFVFSLLRAPEVYLRAVGSFIGTPVVTMVDGLPPELSWLWFLGFWVSFFDKLRNEMDSRERERILSKSEIKFLPLTWTQTLNWLKLEAFEVPVIKTASHHFDVFFGSKK